MFGLLRDPADAGEVVERPVSVAELFASRAAAIGVDGGEVHVAPAGRPVTTVDEAGVTIPELS
ncbi:hypothetical protein [Enhygromyxa salina]|uniref:hypothetical protein n=1 Tax=Enhygromyxa salina TaxID=215803 RepID=UPI0011B227AA|nr:hypothetical protein [Enhygromyxa salina]